MTTEPNTAQSIVDGQLAELQITSAEVTGETYKEQHDAKIKALADEEAEIPVPTDKASLQALQKFITKAEGARTSADKWRLAFKAQWKRIIDPVDAYVGTNKENGIQARIYAIQERAEAKKKAYLDEQAKAQREAERLLEERYNDRVGKLMAIGMAFEPSGNLTIRHGEETATATKEQIRFATDEQMAGAVQRAEIIAERIAEAEAAAQQAKEAEERERQEEAERLAQQKREQEAEQAKLKADREAFEKERAEHAAKVKAIEERKEQERQDWTRAMRAQTLHELGASEQSDGGWVIGDGVGARPHVSVQELRTMTSDEWASILARFKEAAEARDNIRIPDADEALPVFELTPGIDPEQVLWNTPDGKLPQRPVGSAVVGAQPDHLETDVMAGRTNGAAPDHEQQAVAELLEEQHDIHEAINDLSIFADPSNWAYDDANELTVFIGTHVALDTMTIFDFAARALKVLAIEKA